MMVAKELYPSSTMAMPSTTVLAAHHPLRWVTTMPPASKPTSNAKYTTPPVLKPMPKSLTKNNSNLPANWTAPLMSAS